MNNGLSCPTAIFQFPLGEKTMRACIQRVRRAQVTVADEVVGQIGLGMLVLLGVARADGEAEVHQLAEKIAGLRIFEDAQGKMNLALADVGGAMLVVSQFTLLGDCRKGRRPSWTLLGRVRPRAGPASSMPLLFRGRRRCFCPRNGRKGLRP
mgnify:CR=1 FL=1